MTSDRPDKRTRWKHPRMRGTWTVATAGAKWITLSSSMPIVGPVRVRTDDWPRYIGEKWTPYGMPTEADLDRVEQVAKDEGWL